MTVVWHVSPVRATNPGIPENGWEFVSLLVDEAGAHSVTKTAPDRDSAVRLRAGYLAQLRRDKCPYLTYSDLARWRRAVKLLKEKTLEISEPDR